MPACHQRFRLCSQERQACSVCCLARVMSASTELGAEAEALALLGQACKAADLDAGNARLMRLGSNAVYRLASPVVARIAYAGTDAEAARRTVEVARWLASAGYPAGRALSADQPVIIDCHPAACWEALSDTGEEYATIAEVADVIARLHKLPPPEGLALPEIE